MSRAVVTLLLVAAGLPPAAAAQLTGRVAAAGAFVRARSIDPVATTTRNGLAAGIRAAASHRYAGIELRYAEGRLDSAGADVRDFVDVAALATASPAPWVAVLAGARAHALRSNDGTRRWLFWTAGARFMTPRFARRHVAVFGEIWAGVGAVNERDGSQLARGIETGVLGWLPDAPVFARLAYRLDDGRLDAEGLRSTVESVSVGVGYSF